MTMTESIDKDSTLAERIAKLKLRWAADEIKLIRKAVGLSIPECAKLLGVSRWTLWRWETGRSDPDPLALTKMDRMFRRHRV